MTEALSFHCQSCGETHIGWPAWHFSAPEPAHAVPPEERAARVLLNEDVCAIDDREFYAKGLLSVPIWGTEDSLTWGIWLSLDKADFTAYFLLFEDEARAPGASFLGWLCNEVPGFEDEEPLAAKLHVREYPLRPWVELAPTEHPLASAQRKGLARDDAVARVEALLHPDRSP
jgi:hypothetical protein